MRKNEKTSVALYAAFICFISLLASYLTLPHGYRYNSDIFISPVGMMISESYRTVPFAISNGIPGYYTQGVYFIYNSWPPLNFLVLAQWQELFGTDVTTSRWLYIFVKLATDLLCFITLLRIFKRTNISFFSALIFSLFPYHILYGQLIFCDSWILLFGWVITAQLVSAIQKNTLYNNKTIFLMGLVTGIGVLFSWQVFFYLPAILLIISFNRRSFHPGWWLYGLLPVIITVGLWILWIIFHPVSGATAGNLLYPEPSTVFEGNNSALHKFLARSWIRLFNDPASSTILLLKRLAKTILEYSPVILLVIYNRQKNKKTTPINNMTLPDLLIRIHITAGLLYFLLMPFMFAEHEHQIPIFSLLASLVLARELLRLRSPHIISLGIVVFQLLIFCFIIPRIHHADKSMQQLDEKIMQAIKPTYNTRRPLLLLHARHPNSSGLGHLTQTHIYAGKNLQKKFNLGSSDLGTRFRQQLALFPPNLRQQIDTSHLWIFSSDQQLLKQTYSPFNKKTFNLTDSLFLIHLQRKNE